MSTQPVSLTVVVPAYNEGRTIDTVLASLTALHLPCEYEIIVVDDGSSDDTALKVERWAAMDNSRVTHLRQHANYGKGAAVRAGIAAATGTHLLVFDADGEYSARDIPALIQPIIDGRSDVIYGVRVVGVNTVYQSLLYQWGNRLMTLGANVLYGTAISDLHTCLKLVPVELLRRMRLTEMGFGLDTEITAHLLRSGIRPYEVPISYVSRSKAQGKKIGAMDAVRCAKLLVRMRASRKAGVDTTGVAYDIHTRSEHATGNDRRANGSYANA